MNVIFVTLAAIKNISERGIYADLMRKFKDEGHQVYIVTQRERRTGLLTSMEEQDGIKILYVRTLNITKTNIIEKGIGTLLIESQFKTAIEKYLGDVKFDLITYSTPPITFTNVVKYLKKKNPGAFTFLQLKDIFPQNAVDLGMLLASPIPSPQDKGLKNAVIALPKYLLYKYFRLKEKALYKVSDYIGCMSPANVKYLLDHNPDIDTMRVAVVPNSLELIEKKMEDGQEKAERNYIRKKYDLSLDTPIFIYGGNLGKPQGIDYLIRCLDACKKRQDCFFVIVGNGTEYKKLENWYGANKNSSVKVMQRLPKEEYDMLVGCCDVGLIFLDHRFSIPCYPSRLLSYLEYKMPVLCATDPNTDMGRIAEENGFGYWCESVKPEDFTALVDKVLAADRKAMGERGYEFLKQNYLVENTYNEIMKHLKPKP